jgi:hypothetical protein
MAVYAIKVALADPQARHWRFANQKTMYGGKHIAAGDTLFVFDSENAGGHGLVACGVVTAATARPRVPGVERQTPCVSIEVRRTASATRPLGRTELKPFAGVPGDSAESELHFKFYRQATDKIVGLSDAAAALLARCC